MGTLLSFICTNEIAGRARNDESKARNDVPGHPGPDPGPDPSVWTNEFREFEGYAPQFLYPIMFLC